MTIFSPKIVGNVADAKITRLVVVLDGDAAILRVLAFDDVEVRDDLEPADDRSGHRRLDEQDILKLAVDAIANTQPAFLRIEMDIGRLAVAGTLENLVDQLGQADRG